MVILPKHLHDAERELAEYEKGNVVTKDTGTPVIEQVSDAPETQNDAAAQAAKDEVVSDDVQVQQKQEHDNFEQKYKVMQGRIKAEKRRADEEISKREAEIKELRELVLKQAKTEQAPGAASSKSLRDEMGDETANIIERELAARELKIRNDMEERLSRIERKGIEGSEALFRKELSALVPDWMAINNDSDFMEWVDNANGIGSQFTYRDTIDAAYKAFNAVSIAAIFNEYKQLKKASGGKGKEKDLSHLVSPDKSRTQTSSSKPETHVTIEAIDELTRQARVATDYASRAALSEKADAMMDIYLSQGGKNN